METTIINALSQPQVLPYLKMAPWVLAILLVWSLIWKGLALWKAARLSNKWWFIIFLLVNTLGLLEIIYIYFIAKKYTVETESQV
ncbi:MAG: DUF5652 family protein [Candidatus Zambryskibacteria bacterium]|nr:DUF5652 family protein [Candidatus Zambryskibacteria bacterium]